MKRSWLLLSVMLAAAHLPIPARARGPAPSPKPAPARAPAQKEAAPRGAKTAALATQVARSGKSKQPCFARPVQLLRVRGEVLEPRELSLTMCNGSPNVASLDSLSVLARPRDAARPLLPEIRAYRARPLRPKKVSKKSKQKFRDPLFVADHVMRLHPGLLARLQKIADHYPGKAIEIISGYRPDARLTSRHHHGRALDLRVAGVSREQLRDFLRTFEDTGVGYYPNSYFVHMDVRDSKGYWVDRSGPGEPADYGPWPERKEDIERARESVLKSALAELADLKKPVVGDAQRRTAMLPKSSPPARVREPEQEPDDMSADEVARVRLEARRALEQL